MTTKELIDAAQPIILDAVRQQPRLHFTEVTATNYIRTNAVRKVIGLAKDDKGDVSPHPFFWGAKIALSLNRAKGTPRR